MTAMIYNPLEEFEGKFKDLHLENTKKYLNELVTRSAVNVEENRATVKLYHQANDTLAKIKKSRGLWKFLRVLMFITVVLIPLVLWKVTPKIKALTAAIEEQQKKVEGLLAQAERQMAPLNALFSDRDDLNLIEATIPMTSFAPCFSHEQQMNMEINFDFEENDHNEQSTIDVLAGHYNENPFLFEKKLIHKMGMETYHGYKTIHWTETRRSSDGKLQTRTRTQTLHASLTKPKPFYSTQVHLTYCAQGGPELSFTRDATHLERKSEKEIDRYVKKGEKKLKKMTDKALEQNKDFVSMSNSDFEVLFDALDRTNEVQFRTLFTPLAQTNMVDLIRSQSGFGDDFNFIKRNRTNTIVSHHSQGRPITLSGEDYRSYSYDIIEECFIRLNVEFFKAVYFDFAPLWAIPIYQEKPVQSLNPIPKQPRKYSDGECEALSNELAPSCVVHPQTKTRAILKASYLSSKEDADKISVHAYSYDIIPRIDFIPVHGGDGKWHNVPVQWDDYIPLEATNHFYVSSKERTKGRDVLAQRNNLCIYN